tara:strand:- start:2096 stop:3001 length:906 start_codon:yes stop_codon:yes gene_type:complete
MNNSAEDNSGTIIVEETNCNSSVAIESDYILNRSRLQKLKSKIKTIPEILKDYFGSILFVIYGLGAFIQVVEISLIDLSYLRFFSVTQVASDGALVFVALTIFILIGFFYYFFVTLEFKEERSIEDIPIAKPLLILCVVTGLGYGVLANLMIITEEYRKAPILQAFPALMVAFLAFCIKYSSYKRNQIDKLKNNNENKKYFSKGLLWYISILSYLFIPIVTIKLLMVSSEILREPKNFENYNKVGSFIRERHQDVSEYRTLYFNDKYTFVKLIKENSDVDTIEVYKTDAILFDETVIKVKQ